MMVRPDRRVAYETLEGIIMGLIGLTEALAQLAFLHPTLGKAGPENHAIHTLVRLTGQEAARAEKSLDDVWAALGGTNV